MRIDRSRIKKSTSEVPAECQALIDRLRSCSQKELLEELKKIETWTFGKCELYHWIDILDLCDAILEKAAARVNPKSWQLACDLPGNEEIKDLLQWVLYFTTLLIEHSFSRHLYNSVEHLLTLLSSCDLQVVMSVLNLLYMFSKRSNFIARLAPEMRNILLRCLTYLAESWGGKENGFGLADCSNECYCPLSATTVHFEFYADDAVQGTSQISCIHLENVDELDKTPAEIMDGLVEAFKVPKDGQMLLYTHIRLAYSFSDYERRLKCVQARLQALSVLLYSNTFSDSHLLLYSGILDELVELLELNDPALVDIRSAALRTLTSIIHLDRSPHLPKKPGSRLNNIIDVTGAGMYHGFLPQLVRGCICSLTSDSTDTQEQFPLALATALFSFLYHLASYEAGGEALVSCGMMECLLRVINWPGTELEHITFVTRAVRVIDLITNIDMQVFQNHGGLASFINRLEMEIAICRREQPFEIVVDAESTSRENQAESDTGLDEEMMSIEVDSDSSSPSCSKEVASDHGGDSVKSNKTCLPQRAALLKSMLNFLKKALQDPAFSDSIRHVMDGSLPSSLKHIISNAEYYGPSLFLLATDVVAVYVFQEPSLLSSLQDNGLTDVVLHALLVKNVPATREVLGSLPNVFSALCLNARGLESFVKFCPFDRLFKVLLSPTYLSAMRRRRSSEPIGDTASTLGNAMDELMRHQPSLKVDAISAIIRLLDELCRLGKNPKYICWRPQKGSNNGESPHQTPRSGNEGGSSDEEEDDEEEASTSSHPQREDTSVDQASAVCHEKTPVALVDYILNVMKFIDAILSNNSTDDHCREFVNQNGLSPLLSILGLPNLPVDYPITPAAQSVASVCKSILNLAHEAKVLGVGLTQLSMVLTQLQPLQKSHSRRKGSVLLNELASAACIDTAFSTPLATPMLHAMAAAHGYVVMFVHVCRTGQLDIRTISMTQWGSEPGLSVLEGLAELYTALVWESTILLALCSEDVSCDFNKEDIEKLLSPDIKSVDVDISSEMGSGGMTAAMEQLNTNLSSEPMEVDTSPGSSPSSAKNKSGVTSAIQLKYIKPLLGASSRLGRALAELFGLLVKLCVGFPVRNRRGNHLSSTPISPTPSAQAVASELAGLLARGLKFDKLPLSPVPKFRLTYLICSVGFTSPMLFDEKKYPYHLMLQKFVLLKGQKAFFDSFMWALSGGGKFDADDGLEHADLPEGTGEFLDAWLLLLEKMVNPKAILDSTHILPTRSTSVGVIKMFDPVRYLQQVHKLAFDAIGYLWGRKPLKTYGERMTDTLLIICRHILRGEKIIEERKLKDLDVVVANPSAEGRRGQGQREHRPEVNMNEMAQLMDMGFSREHCYEALILTSTIEHATDYLLNNFFPQHSQAARFISPIDEEEEEFEPLVKEDLDKFSQGALRICLKLLEALPGTVYRVCDLLTTIMRRNGEKFTYDLLSGLAKVLIENLTFMTLILDELKLTDEEVVAAMTTSVEAQRVAAIIHLYMLLFEEIRIPCAKVVHSSGMLPLLIQLLVQGTAFLEMNPTISTPKWLAPLLLLIDLLEKVSVITNRKGNMHKVTTHIWRWFDLTTGKWALYLPLNNKLINDSYWKGDNMLRIVSGRRHYTIMFNQMIQTNEDSGKQRPIMMSLVENREGATSLSETREDDDSPSSSPILVTRAEASRATLQSSNGDSMEYEPATDFYHRRTGLQGIPGVGTINATHIVRTCVRLMKIPVDGDTLHAVLQVCVRFTRDYDNAEMAAEMGVVKILLNLTSTTVFSGFLGLATILIRHILEEPGTLYSAMEKVIRAKTLANIPSSYKELHYILRECSAAICRDPETFKAAAKEILRIDVSLLNKRSDEEDTRLLMKSVTNPTGGIGTVTQNLFRLAVSKSVIYDLLDALIEPDEEDINIHEPPESESPMFMEMQSPLINSAAPRRMGDINPVNPINPDDVTTEQLNRVTSQPFDPSALPVYMALTQPPNTLPTPASSSSSSKSGTSERKLKMLGKAAVLKILGDAVRSYSNVAKIITEFRYKANKSPLIKEDCSPVAFVLDHLLSLRERALIDLDVASMARMLIAALASCNHSPDAQAALVSEVKAALTRTLAWPESKKKHYHIQDIVGIVTIMIESCPHVPLCNSPLNSAVKLHQYSANNMVRLMMRKGIATDLARISHSLDLSSPKLSATMNAVLKPLETLSRIMSQPSGVQPGKLKTKPRTPAPSSDEPRTSTSEATHAQGEESVEDADNTDHDVSGTAEIVSEAINQQEDVMDADEISDGFVLTRDAEPVADSESNTRTRYNLFEGAGDLSFQSMNNDETIQSSTEDSESNSSDERIDVDAPTDIDEQVEEMIEGENEGDETGGAYDEEGLELSESDEGLFHIPGLDPDSDDFLMIEYSDPEAPPQLGPWTANATFPLSFSIFEDPTTIHADSTGGLNRIPSQHPLLMTRQNLDSSSGLSSSRAQRLNRTRRYQYVQMNRTSAAPVFLQRLMGQTDQTFSSNGNTNNPDVISTFGSNTRVIVMDNGLGILTNTEEEQINFVDQAGYLLGPSLAATLNNVPTSMHWWNEEGRLLDGESQADCAVVMGHELIPVFEKFRNEECMERKEKRRKHDDVECNKKTDAVEGEKKAFSNDGSVPFPAPTDPDDGYYRVNPPEGYRSAPVDMSSAPHSSSSFFINHQCNLHSTVSETGDQLEIETTNWVRSTETNEGTTETSRVQPPQETSTPEYSTPQTSQPDPSDQSTIILDIQSISGSEINLNSSRETISASDTSQNTSEHSSSPSNRPPSGSALNPIELGSSPMTDSQDEEVPEGVDPSFLAALPEDMRAEVVAEQFRLQRIRQQVSEVSAAATGNDTAGAIAGPSGTNLAAVLEVNPDFLAALPPAIQEEVLAQQRLEQQRQAASTSNPNDPVDAAAFFQDLPHTLRQAILTDMEESQISVLPPDLAAEAQNLRRDWEARNRQLMQERFLSHVSNSTSALSSILRTSVARGTRRAPGTRYAIRSLPTASGPRDWAREFGPRHHRLVHNITSVTGQASSSANPASLIRSRGRQVLDYESICCLLVLLFIEDSRLNTVRLHRVFRNLCCHAPTRDWVVKALLSIMEKSNITQTVSRVKETFRPRGGKRMTTRSQVQPDSISFLGNQAQRPPQAAWLNISMDAALGCRATVFTVHRSGRRSEKSITINPQAAPFVYRHALDILISLAKIFPICFTPAKGAAVTTGTVPKLPVRSRHELSNFWEILIYLDSLSRSKKGKVAARTVTQAANNEAESSLEASPFGLLLTMLDAPVISRSPALMDKLLRLLSVISVSLQLNKQPNVYKLETTGGVLKPLSLAVNVLTSCNCSEEGLEDATALLLNMSVNLPNTRDVILWLLLECAHKMAAVVCGHIERLLKELRELNSQQNQNDEMEASTSESKGTPLKGVLSNRFTKDIVVVTAPKKVKAGLDLQLSSMAPLICKNSSQSFFLRILKVIVQIRDSMKSGDKKDKKEDTQVQEGNERGEIPTPMDTGSPVPPRHGRPTCSSPDVFASNDDDDDDEDEDDESDGNLQQPEQPQQHQQLPQPQSQSQAQQEIRPLSEQLNLGELWDTLSNCLTELAHTQDSHAVLVLQPAVEAFFLVHAAGIEKPTTENNYTIQHSAQAGPSTSNDPGPSVSEEFGAPAPPPVSPLPNEPAPDSVATALAHMSYTPVGLDHAWVQNMSPHQQKFLKFAETHRTVLNQILRQCTTPLLEGPFAVLVNHTRVLDFDVKRRYFRSELERADEGHRREELAVHVRRTHVFEDSFRELHRRVPNDWKNRFYIVFEGEEGQDAGGLLREWYMIISREIFNPNYALFTISPGDRVTYTINPSSHCNSNHLSYFKFVGRVIAKAIYDNKLLECYFTRSFYKHILGIRVKYTDMESEDYSFYQGLAFLMDNDVKSLGSELTFSTEVQEFGVTEIRDLIPSGRHMLVTEKNKMDYIRLVCQLKMTGAIRQQLDSFLEGFYDIIPKRLISIFNEQELELLISGLPNVDIDDLKANTEYYKYQPNSLQIQWFWRALREFDQAERAKFLQFVTGTSKVPLQGFAALEGMNGVQKFQIHRDERSTDRLPSAHTCFNQLDLPVYETYTKLRTYLLKAIHECSEGFGFA